jgi:hypothetical protein
MLLEGTPQALGDGGGGNGADETRTAIARMGAL